MAGLGGGDRLGLAAPGGGGKFTVDIGVFIDARGGGPEIAHRLHAARRAHIAEPRLIPFDANRLDYIIEDPALFLPAPDMRLAVRHFFGRLFRSPARPTADYIPARAWF